MADESTAITKPEKKANWVTQFVERAHASVDKAPDGVEITYLGQTGSLALDLAEGGILGALLGAAHAKWGLDTPFGPLDGLTMGLGSFLGVALAKTSPGAAAIARSVAGKSATVFSFRKSYEVIKHQPLLGGVAPAAQIASSQPGTGPGIHGEDPIERVARSLG